MLIEQHAKYSAHEITVKSVIIALLGLKLIWPHDDRLKEQVLLFFLEDQNIILYPSFAVTEASRHEIKDVAWTN